MEHRLFEHMVPEALRVVRNRKETADTRTLELAAPSGKDLPTWHPGQFMMLYVFGVGEIPISISGDPGRSKTLVHTIRAVGSVSSALCKAGPGAVIGARGPFGSFWPTERYEGHDVLVIAGGVGLAPLRPVLYKVMKNRDRYGRVTLLVGARNPEIVLYRHELQRWARRNIDVRVTVDFAAHGWEDSVGPVTTLIPRVDLEPAKTVAFVVGPEIMMRFVIEALEKLSMPKERLFISMERNMKCAIGLCGRCQFGPSFICKDGPVFEYSRLEPWLAVRNL